MADSGLSEQDDEDVSRTSELVAPEIVLETTPSTPETQSPRASPQPRQNAASASQPGYRPEYVPSGHQWNMGNQPPMLAMTPQFQPYPPHQYLMGDPYVHGRPFIGHEGFGSHGPYPPPKMYNDPYYPDPSPPMWPYYMGNQSMPWNQHQNILPSLRDPQKHLWKPPMNATVYSGTMTRSKTKQTNEVPARKPRTKNPSPRPTHIAGPTTPSPPIPETPVAVTTVSPVRENAIVMKVSAAGGGDDDDDDGDSDDDDDEVTSQVSATDDDGYESANDQNASQRDNREIPPPGNSSDGNDPPDNPPGNNGGSDDDANDNPRNNRSTNPVRIPSPVLVSETFAENISDLNRRLDSFRSTSVMAVKSIEMSMTKIDKVSIEEFKFKAKIACQDMLHLNPAIWLSKSVLNTLLLQAKKDITNSAKSASGMPRFSAYSQMTTEQLYTQIGKRSESGELVGVDYIVRVMTRCIADTTHLFQTCLKDFTVIDCRGTTPSMVRGMHTKVGQVLDHWNVSMSYVMDRALSKLIIKSLNSKLQGKLFDTNFYRTLLNNKNECEKQMHEENSKKTADNDLTLWLAVLDYTISTFEDQLEFASGSGVPSKPSSTTRTRNQEKSLANISPSNDRKKKGNTGPTPAKPKSDDKPAKELDTSNMICFNCGKKGEKTGHTDCKHAADPNAAGIKAKDAYKKKQLEKKKKAESASAVATIDAVSDSSDEESEDDVCMISSWPRTDDIESDDSDSEDPCPDLVPVCQRSDMPGLTPLKKLNTTEDWYKKPNLQVSFSDTSQDSRKSKSRPYAFYKGENTLGNIEDSSEEKTRILLPGTNKLAIFQDVIINSLPATVLFDTGALGPKGNWISADAAERLNAFLEPTKKKSYRSPLFPDARFISKTKTCLTMLFTSFGFEIEHIEFKVMDASGMKAEIILGLEFCEQYDIMSYISNPDCYNSVEAPLAASEECLDWEEGLYAFQSAILDLPGTKVELPSDHDYRSGINVCKDFPCYERACSILERFHGSVFTNNLSGSTINHPPMNIKPIKEFLGCKPRRMNADKQAFLDIWLDRKLKAGIIEPCNGDPSNTTMPTSPLILVKKPPPSVDPYRVTLDAAEVNKCMPKIKMETPITRECLQKLGGHKYYWKADMCDYFFQFEVSSDMANLYAFSTHRGIFRFKKILPQGDQNSPPWTTNAMQHILIPIREEVSNYVDDFAGGDDEPEILCDKLERFLTLMEVVNAKLSPPKVFVGFTTITHVGFVVDKNGYRPKQNQLDKFQEAPFPTKEKLRSWFGLLNTFRDFIPNLQQIDEAFSAVRKKNAPWVITPAMTEAFDIAKMAVANISFLVFPDESKDLILDADASNLGCGAILYHLAEDGMTKLPIRFMSHIFTTAAIKWSTIEKECWALVKAFNTFEAFLFGRSFRVRTDHRNLLYMQHSCNAKVQRWFGYLMLFDFIITHVPGIDNIVADALSRIFAFMCSTDSDDTDDEETERREDQAEIAQQEVLLDSTWDLTSLQEMFIRFHNGITGHLSLANTIQAIKDAGCNAPHLKQHVIRMLAKCGPCEKARSIRPRPVLEYHTNSSFKPFEVFQADFLTGIGKSTKGYSCILAFVCTFTRYTMLYPCVDQTASSVNNALLHLWGIFGSLRQLTSDGAACFTSKEVADVCKLLRIKQFITQAYDPGGHSVIERRNKEIQKIARKVFLDIVDANEKNWEEYIPLVQRILNAQTNITTGFSPYHLVFGTAVTQDLKALESPAFDIATIQDPNAFVRSLDNTLNIVFQSGLASVEDTIMRNYLKQPASKTTFKEGQFVVMPNHRHKAQALGKFSPQLIGPLRIVKDFQNDFYELKDIVQDESVFAHGCDLRTFDCENEQQALQIAATDYNELTIHSVIGHEGNPDKLGQLFFTVTFSDDPTMTTSLPYREVKYVQSVRDYIDKNKVVLRTAAADLRKQDKATPSKRIKRISQTLKGYEI